VLSPPDVRVDLRVDAQPGQRGEGSRFRVHVKVENHGERAVRLLSRCWKLIDADHRVAELRGPCVAGQRPELLPGARYDFASTVHLATEWGSFEGNFRVLDAAGGLLEVEIERHMLSAAAPVLA